MLAGYARSLEPDRYSDRDAPEAELREVQIEVVLVVIRVQPAEVAQVAPDADAANEDVGAAAGIPAERAFIDRENAAGFREPRVERAEAA